MEEKKKKRGRPRRSELRSHLPREILLGRHPSFITMKVVAGIPNLRNKIVLNFFQTACKEAKHFGLHVVHFCIQSNHFHMLVETRTNDDLATGMKSFGSRLAKNINRHASRKGQVFKDRFHLDVLKTARSVKNVIKYIYANHSRHLKRKLEFDFTSSAPVFRLWKKLFDGEFSDQMQKDVLYHRKREEQFPNEYENLRNALSPPKFWLSREGWLQVS